MIEMATSDRFRPTQLPHYRRADAFLVLFDLSWRKTFEGLPTWLSLIDSNHHDPLVYLIGHKADRKDRQVTRQEMHDFAALHPLLSVERVIETSATTGVGIQKLFAQLSKCQANSSPLV